MLIIGHFMYMPNICDAVLMKCVFVKANGCDDVFKFHYLIHKAYSDTIFQCLGINVGSEIAAIFIIKIKLFAKRQCGCVWIGCIVQTFVYLPEMLYS